MGYKYKRYKMHRLAFLYMTGEWPEKDIDHINGDTSDNRWCNLRDVAHQENLGNRSNLTKTNKTGHVGVCFDSKRNKYKAYHTTFGKQKLIGRFDTIEAAAEARRSYLYHLQ